MKQVKEKVLLIAEALQPKYSLLFLFDNATSHSIYLVNVFWIKNMSKRLEGKQAFLRDSWYCQDWFWVTEKMYTENADNTRCQKDI